MNLAKERDFNWAFEAKGYSSGVQQELADEKLTQAWRVLFREYLPPADTAPVIVDVGTGPGFFPILLSQMGYTCIGADISPEMLEEARSNAQNMGVSAEFVLGDADNLPFAEGSVDCIISRNVTWTLLNAQETYRKWLKLLAPKGKIIIFDANWNYQYHNESLMEKVQEDYREYERIYGKPATTNTERQDAYRKQSPMCQVKRPQWDLNALSDLDIQKMICNFNITDMVWPVEKQIRFHSTPMFMIIVEK